jgi:hypothetical protein
MAEGLKRVVGGQDMSLGVETHEWGSKQVDGGQKCA